jgi:hypothetical protein
VWPVLFVGFLQMFSIFLFYTKVNFSLMSILYEFTLGLNCKYHSYKLCETSHASKWPHKFVCFDGEKITEMMNATNWQI